MCTLPPKQRLGTSAKHVLIELGLVFDHELTRRSPVERHVLQPRCLPVNGIGHADNILSLKMNNTVHTCTGTASTVVPFGGIINF